MPTRRHRFHRSPWAMLIALIASVPAFYDSMMPTPATWATWMYVVSGFVVLGWAWSARRAARRGDNSHTWGMRPSEERLDWFLGASLLLSAVLPQSNESEPALAWRLVISVLMLYRLLKISMPLLTETGLARLLVLGAAVLGLCGIGFYWLDPGIKSVNEGLWLAFSTAATVGYGDVVPSSTASRVFSVFVVLLGYGVLSLVTASIAAMFVGTQERKVEREILRDMHEQLKTVHEEIAELREELRAELRAARHTSQEDQRKRQ
ncbi:voltage-gated potassium channel [Aquabacterium commune]|uniref:Voltage-gated potassium channel n=1 Tax=Aquabacterium commune TaxID=70586 RepID=A0A4R6R7D2_9BURK|nr:potassium channel family protein [Aquabacterium commune]TDP81645.1 voltage-gated potassium channel [Aquabacterium commune]